jgi:hypothetical protein
VDLTPDDLRRAAYAAAWRAINPGVALLPIPAAVRATAGPYAGLVGFGVDPVPSFGGVPWMR